MGDRNYFRCCINVGKWNYFDKITNENRVETFLSGQDVKAGDIYFLWITKKGISAAECKDKEDGVYAVGEVLSASPFIKRDTKDWNDGHEVLYVDIKFFNKGKPFGKLTELIKDDLGHKTEKKPCMITTNEEKRNLAWKEMEETAEFKPFGK